MAIRQTLMDNGVAMRNMGAGALQLAHVAAGRYDGFVELSLNAWDALAGLLLTEEAGGYIAPFPGRRAARARAGAGLRARHCRGLTKLVGVW